MKSKLYKSEDNRVLCGVCGGIGEYFGVDPTVIRIIWAVLAFVAGGGLILYLIAAILIPREPID